MNALLERAKVLYGSVLARLSALLIVLIFISDHIGAFGDVPPGVTQTLTKVIAGLTIIVFQVRKHTPVSAAQTGLLPPQGPGTPTVDVESGQVHLPDAGNAQLHILLGIVAIVCGVLIILVGIGAITMHGTAPFTIIGIGITAAGLTALV